MAQLKIKKDISKELIEEYTNEYVLLGLFYFANQHRKELGRMKTAKLLTKFKEQSQKKGLQAYHTEFYKDTHGEFSKEIYDQINNLQTAGFIETKGVVPRERFKLTKKGRRFFEEFNPSSERNTLEALKEELEKVIDNHGHKSAYLLRAENHQKNYKIRGRVKNMDELPDKDENIILQRNLSRSKIKHEFIFDKESALDWSIAISLGERKKREKINPEEDKVMSQNEIYESLGI